MRSTKTRLAASVLAITIPLVPTAAHADPEATELPSVNQAGVAHSSAIAVTDTLSRAEKSEARLTTQQKEIVSGAIESASAAALQSLLVHESQRSNNPLDTLFLDEQRLQAATAVDAAYAEVSHALSILGMQSRAVHNALTLILEDLDQLRA